MAAKCATDDLLLKPVDEHAESVRVVYVVSRMIEFIEVGGGDTLAKRLQQLRMLIQRDKVQSELNYARAIAMQQQTTVLRPAVQCWQKAAGRLARPAEKRRLSVANRFAALGCDLGQSDEASTESTVGSDSSSTTARALNCLRQTAEEGQRRKRRRPALRAMQDLENQSKASQASVQAATQAPFTAKPHVAGKCTRLVREDEATRNNGITAPTLLQELGDAGRSECPGLCQQRLAWMQTESMSPTRGDSSEAQQKPMSQDALLEHIIALEDQVMLAKEQQQGKLTSAASAEMRGALSEMRQHLDGHDFLLKHIISLELDIEKANEQLRQQLGTELIERPVSNSGSSL